MTVATNLDDLSDLMRRCGNIKVDKTKFGDVFYVSVVLVTSLRGFITEAGLSWGCHCLHSIALGVNIVLCSFSLIFLL